MNRINVYYTAPASSTNTTVTTPARSTPKQWENSNGWISKSPYDPANVDPFSDFDKAAMLGVDVGGILSSIPSFVKMGAKAYKHVAKVPKIFNKSVTRQGVDATNTVRKIRSASELAERVDNPNWAAHAEEEYRHVRAKAKRLLSQKNKWVGQHPDTEELLKTAEQRHDPFYTYEELGGRGDYTSHIVSDFDYPHEYSGRGKKIGYTRTAPTRKYVNSPGFVARHEIGHYYTNLPREANDWISVLDRPALEKIVEKTRPGEGRAVSDYMFGRTGDEIRERAAQLKDFIAEKKGLGYDVDFPVTRKDVDMALSDYLKTHPDNNMKEFIGSVANRDLLTWNMNRYALGLMPFVNQVIRGDGVTTKDKWSMTKNKNRR